MVNTYYFFYLPKITTWIKKDYDLMFKYDPKNNAKSIDRPVLHPNLINDSFPLPKNSRYHFFSLFPSQWGRDNSGAGER